MTIRTRPADSGFLAFLREETAEAHRQLESLPLSRQIIAPGVSLVDYRRYLEVMYPVVAETEDRIFPLLREALPDLDLRRKLSLIESDLEVLGSDRKEKIPGFFAGDDVLTVYHAMGVMYVMEGSTLGGRVILKNLTASLGLSEDRGLRFFSGYGPDSQRRRKPVSVNANSPQPLLPGWQYRIPPLPGAYLSGKPQNVPVAGRLFADSGLDFWGYSDDRLLNPRGAAYE